MVSPSENGFSPKAIPSRLRTSFKTKISPSQIPSSMKTKPLTKVPLGASIPVSMKMSKP